MLKQPIVGTGLRGNVERLLRRDIRDKDLRELFIEMREEFGGKGLVGEIANFLAHPTRTQGIVVQETRDLFMFLRFRLPFSRSRIITTDLPASFPEAMRANLRRMRKSVLKNKTGMNRARATMVLEQILSRMTFSASGRVIKTSLLSQDEYAVASCVFSNLRGGSLFTDSDLFEDLYRALQKKALLLPAEKQQLKKSKMGISLFALTAMHNRTIELGDGTLAKLSIFSDPKRRLGIFAVAEVDRDALSGRRKEAAGWIFETGLPIADYCEHDVPPLTERVPFIGNFEITPQLKLARLK